MSNSNVQSNATAVITPSPLLLAEFSRCKNNPDLAINNYFNCEKDPNKSDKVIYILNHSLVEFFESQFNYDCISVFCLYKLIFFNDVNFCYFCKNENKASSFRRLLSKSYIESKLKLKPLLLISTQEKFMFFNHSQLRFTNNIKQFCGLRFTCIIIDDCTQELYTEILPEISSRLEVFRKLGCENKIIKVNRLS